MRLKGLRWVVLVIALMICSACTQSSASVAMSDAVLLNSSSAGTDSPPLYCKKTQLLWEVPQCEYRIIETVSGENGFAVLYTEQRTWNGDSDRKPNFYLMVQLFDAQGNHVRTAYTGVWCDSDEDLTLNSVQLTDTKLDYALNGNYHYSMDTATGYVSQWCYETLLEEDQTSLSYSTNFQETPYTLGMRFCLTDAKGKNHEIVIPEYDHNFGMALDFLINPEYADREGVTYEATVTLDSSAKTAEVTNTKLTYTLDFNDLSYTCARRYTDEMIEEVLATSPDGTRTLRRADSGAAGDGGWSDVVLTEQDGSITYLCYNTGLYDTYFLDDNIVLLNLIDKLWAFDLTKTPPIANSVMDLGRVTEADGDIHPEREVIGLSIDRKNQLILIATRDYNWDVIRVPVTLTVLDRNFQQTAVIKTGYKIYTYYNNWPARCDIAINDDGTANLSWREEPPVQVRYLV